MEGQGVDLPGGPVPQRDQDGRRPDRPIEPTPQGVDLPGGPVPQRDQDGKRPPSPLEELNDIVNNHS